MANIGTKGGVDPNAWVAGTLGFSLTFASYILFGPALKALYEVTIQSTTSVAAHEVAAMVDMLYNYGMVILGAGYLVYILYSSFRKEAEDTLTPMRYR